MHIVAIAWIYVTFLMAVTETSVVAGVATFVLYGLLPLGIIMYVFGTPMRKARRRAAEAAADGDAEGSVAVPADRADQPDRTDAKRDQ